MTAPIRAPLLVVIIGIFFAVIGWQLRWVEVVAVGAGIVLLAVMAVLIRPPLSASWSDVEVPTRVVRGDGATLQIDVMIEGSSRWVRAVSSGTGQAWPVPADGALAWPIDSSRRGQFLVGPDRLEYADPFGMRRIVLAERTPTSVLVVPRVSVQPSIDPRSLTQAGLLGERAGVEQFASLREYVVGDPLKLVHWKASAHAGVPMVRRMVDATVPSVLVVLDVDSASYPMTGSLFFEFGADHFERAVDVAASLAWHACVPGQRVLLTSTAMDAPVVGMSAGSREVGLDWLALVEGVESSSCLPGRVLALARSHGAGRIVVVTGSGGSGAVRGLGADRSVAIQVVAA